MPVNSFPTYREACATKTASREHFLRLRRRARERTSENFLLTEAGIEVLVRPTTPLIITVDGSPGLAQVQLVFDTAQDFIIDTAFVAQANHGLTLHAHGLKRKLGLPIVTGCILSTPGAGLKSRQT